MDTSGFKQMQTNEHEFARFLRKHKAIDNWHSKGSANYWVDPSGHIIALCLYDNAATTNTYWVRDSLAGEF